MDMGHFLLSYLIIFAFLYVYICLHNYHAFSANGKFAILGFFQSTIDKSVAYFLELLLIAMSSQAFQACKWANKLLAFQRCHGHFSWKK